MALDAEPAGDDAKAEAAQSPKQPAAKAKAKKARRKKVRRLRIVLPCIRRTDEEVDSIAMASMLCHRSILRP